MATAKGKWIKFSKGPLAEELPQEGKRNGGSRRSNGPRNILGPKELLIPRFSLSCNSVWLFGLLYALIQAE